MPVLLIRLVVEFSPGIQLSSALILTLQLFFLIRCTFLRKRIEDAEFKIDDNFKIIFLYNVVKATSSIDTKYWTAALEVNELEVGTFLLKLSDINIVESRTNININI